jgi:hypothetical protein
MSSETDKVTNEIYDTENTVDITNFKNPFERTTSKIKSELLASSVLNTLLTEDGDTIKSESGELLIEEQ